MCKLLETSVKATWKHFSTDIDTTKSRMVEECQIQQQGSGVFS